MTLGDFTVFFVFPLLGAAFLIAMVRLVRGPALADRVVALEVIGATVMCVLGVLAVVSGSTSYFDVAMAIALITFLGTIAVAVYIQRGAGK
jgi:multisubunit Na+/H+ antiporter MnhF subunit